jgi:HlyD family secretion protein
MRRVMSWLLFLAGTGLFGALVFLAFRPEPIVVEVAEVSCGPMQVTVDVEGRTRVRNRFVISTPVDGKLGRIALREGDDLKPGAVIARLTPAPLDTRTIRTGVAGVRAADAERRAAESNFEKAKVARDQAWRDRERIEQLAANGIASRHQLEQAVLAADSAEKAYDAALRVSEAAAFHVEEAEAALLSAEHDDPSAHALNSQIPIRSPVGGRVLRVVQKSERVVSAGDPLIEVADAREMELVFEALSSDAVKIPDHAEVLVEHWGGEEILRGAVRRIEPSAFTKVSALGVEEQRVNVVASLSDPQILLGDGYRVEGRIVIWQEPSVVKLPISALFTRQATWHVFVVSAGVAIARPVQIGHRNDVEAEVLSGVSEGETVILYPSDVIADGVAVRAR